MHARVTTFPGLAPERIKATLEHFKTEQLPQFEAAPGYIGMWAGVDFTGGRAIAVTFWESLDAMHATDSLAGEIRAVAITKAGVDRERPTITDRYEVVIQKNVVTT
jgi:hypothetical protein